MSDPKTTAKKNATFTSNYFTLKPEKRWQENDVSYVRLRANDRFGNRRHSFERRIFSAVTAQMEKYLRKRPHLDATHPKNYVTKIIYFPSAMRAWAAYMPGGFATFHVHNPDRTHLKSGHKIDYITKNLFKHASDAIGLRSRAYAMAWWLHGIYSDRKQLSWLSIATGTGQPTFDAARLFDADVTFHLTDISSEALSFAKTIAEEYGVKKNKLHLSQLDLRKKKAYEALLDESKPDIIEAMGLFEYLSDAEASQLIKRTLSRAKKGSTMIFTNMHSDHPQLSTHKRGLGWPDVIPRTPDEVLKIMTSAGVKRQQISILLPDDSVYAVYAVAL